MNRIAADTRYGTRAIHQLIDDTLDLMLPPASVAEIRTLDVVGTPAAAAIDGHGRVAPADLPERTPRPHAIGTHRAASGTGRHRAQLGPGGGDKNGYPGVGAHSHTMTIHAEQETPCTASSAA